MRAISLLGSDDKDGGGDAGSKVRPGRLELGQSKPIKLDTPGKDPYFCEFHRFMTGTVEVVE